MFKTVQLPIRRVAYSAGFTTMAEFDRTCPACLLAYGVPKAVTAARGTYMVTLACGQCGHQWTAERKPDVQLFQPRHNQPHHTP